MEMQFFIPPQVREVQCHLTWMGEAIEFLERSMLDRSETMEDHINSLKKRDDEEDNDGDVATVTDENFEENYNEHNPKFCSVYASRLNEAAKLTYLQEFQEAQEKLELLDRIYDRLEVYHRAAFKYAVDVMRWSIKTWKNFNASEAGGEEETAEDAVIFQRRWKELQEDSKSKAVFKYLWGCLGATLKVMEECLIDIYRQSVSLDPDYHVWYAVVYRAMRGNRRNMQRQQSGHLDKPGEEEQRMCKEAFNLNPDIYLSTKDMAIMLKETLWSGNEDEWDKNESTYLRCEELFRKALAIATERSQPKWTKRVQVYLAEFLLFGRGRKLDQVEGKDLFDKCLAENPQDTTVLHKVGKLCHYGAAGKGPDNKQRRFRNWQLAENFYDLALKSKPGNYPCVKDYLKLLMYQEKYEDYIEICDWVMSDLKRDFQISDLKILRGCVIWIFDPEDKQQNSREDACESWLHVVSKLPDFADHLYATISKPPFTVGKTRKPAYINSNQLTNTLKRMQKSCPKKDEERLSAIKIFMENVPENSK